MEIPIIPLTDPEKQLEIVGDFCTPEEAKLLDSEVSEKATTMA